MRSISRYPITPSSHGEIIDLPIGAEIISVSLNISQYFLHVLASWPANYERRRVCAYLDEDIIADDTFLGTYLGNVPQAGEQRRWHFFDAGVVA